jgi:glycosyltransferase involved in cell wall biosynthesis
LVLRDQPIPRTETNQPLNIALVTETYPPEINGVAMTLSHLVEGLAQRGHKMTVVRPRQSKTDAPSVGKEYAEHLFRGVPLPGYPMLKLGLPARGAMVRHWTAQRPDLVHIATEGPLGYSALLAARKLRIPLSSSFHTNFHSYSEHYGFPFLARTALAYLRHFHNRTLATLSPTVELNAQLEKDGFRNLRLLSRGVNTQIFTPQRRSRELRAQLGSGDDDLLVVHVSRLAPEKNYRLLLEAFGRVREHVPNSKFVIVSDGPLRRKLERQNSHVKFTGFLPREELAAHYASADLFLYASLTETFGNVVTEAMASGLPVVAFNYAAAARYIRHENNGWLVTLGDRNAFLEASVTVATSAERRRNFGREARKTAEGISWDRVIDRLELDFCELSGSRESDVALQAKLRNVSASS